MTKEEHEQKLEQAEKDLSDYQFNYPTIKELQKENAEFKEQLARITEERNGYKITVNSYEHTIRDLRKENADLKAKNKWYSEQICNKECAEVWGNLDKARDLLAKWVELFKPKLEGFPKTPVQKETERFLKEQENDTFTVN